MKIRECNRTVLDISAQYRSRMMMLSHGRVVPGASCGRRICLRTQDISAIATPPAEAQTIEAALTTGTTEVDFFHVDLANLVEGLYFAGKAVFNICHIVDEYASRHFA
jgi:hypothetical protein